MWWMGKARLGLIPLLLAGLVAFVGWWSNDQVRAAIQQKLKDDLQTVLEANVTALEIWTLNQKKLASSVISDPGLRQAALALLATNRTDPGDFGRRFAPPEPTEFERLVEPKLRAADYELAHLVHTNGFIVAESNRRRSRAGSQVAPELQATFTELFATGEAVVMTPYKPSRGMLPGRGRGFRGLPGPDPRGQDPRSWPGPPPRITAGRGPDARDPSALPRGDSDRTHDITLMQVAVPIRDDNRIIRGALAMVINPEAEFTRILSVARPGLSGETYAFDPQGLMISKSRFDDLLKKSGLIENREGASSALSLQLRDPGGDLSQGYRPSEGTNTRPLIYWVSDAVNGGSGISVKPRRDYRGVPVVSAWRWLPEQGFGVATQMDAREAYRPLAVLNRIFILLFCLLVVTAGGLLFFSYLSWLWHRRFTQAQLRARQLGQYTLEDKIGEGGMGVVYRAHHALLRRETAIKLLRPEQADAATIAQFEREVRLTCKLTNPSTIQVYDFGHTPDGLFYYAMEYLEGFTLHDLVKQFGPQPEGRVIHILSQVCDSLAEAHAAGLVHRDIKPANIFLCERGGVADLVKVLDFGLVQQLRRPAGDGTPPTGPHVYLEGTPNFMAPEAFDLKQPQSSASDLYGVGALAYYLLTGTHVFHAESLEALRQQHLTQSPVPPSRRLEKPICPLLETALMRCLEKDPRQRPPSASQLRAQLQASPSATGWDMAARLAWWETHREQARRGTSLLTTRPSDQDNATLQIDFAARTRTVSSAAPSAG